MIREYQKQDLKDINNLIKNFDYKLDDNSFSNEFLNIVIYEEENDIKGVLIYEFFYDRIEIDYIIVDSEYRGLGIATNLLKYLENKYKNIDNITLEVRESNKPAIKFYLKNGFKEVIKRKNYYKDEDGILMIKNLGE